MSKIVDASVKRYGERLSQSLAGLTPEEMRKIREGGRDITLAHPL